VNRLLAIAACSVIAGCAGSLPEPVPTCQSDAECGENQVCFPLQGCGDPGGGLVVEIQGNTREGHLAQDFAIGDGGFSPTIDFNLKPATVRGEFLRDMMSYANPVTVRASGVSALIPGLVRGYQATFTKPERGTYSLPVGAGQYVITAEATDVASPPRREDVNVGLGTAIDLNFSFSSADKTIAVTGRLLKRIDSGPTAMEIPVQALMDVQAYDPATLRPMSQKARVTSNGDFILFVAPEVQSLGTFGVAATPHEAGALVPSKNFELRFPLESEIRLQLGEYGDPLPQMRGELRTTGGVLVPGASVYLEGPVNGGGTFRSKVVVTGAAGTTEAGVFRVDLLPSAVDGSYLLTALPPSSSAAGVVQKQIRAVSIVGKLPYFQISGNSENTAVVVCPDKITVIGSVVLPEMKEDSFAVGTKVVARAVEQLKELGKQPLPMGDTETLTDEVGRFSLELDPGIYQIDFIPKEDLPRTTRVVTVRATEVIYDVDAGLASKTVDLGKNLLRKGRKVTGTVFAPNATTGVAQVAPYASVRYFRVSDVGGTRSSLLLGEAITDSMGNYSIILPAK
jgi:hypothetical protein